MLVRAFPIGHTSPLILEQCKDVLGVDCMANMTKCSDYQLI